MSDSQGAGQEVFLGLVNRGQRRSTDQERKVSVAKSKAREEEQFGSEREIKGVRYKERKDRMDILTG